MQNTIALTIAFNPDCSISVLLDNTVSEIIFVYAGFFLKTSFLNVRKLNPNPTG